MSSTVLFINQKGEEVVARHFRNDVPRTAIDTFRNKVGENNGKSSEIHLICF